MKKSNPFRWLQMKSGIAIKLTGAMRKQILAGLLTICMIFAMLPLGFATVSASTAATETANFFANPTRAIELLGPGASWDALSKTLTLNDVSFETSANFGLLLPSDSVIILNGTNTIINGTGTAGISSVDGFGNYFDGGVLTFAGDGTLTVDSSSIFGIYAFSRLNLTDHVTVSVNNDNSSGWGILSNAGIVNVIDRASLYVQSRGQATGYLSTSPTATVEAFGATRAISRYLVLSYKPSAWAGPNQDGSGVIFISDISMLDSGQLSAYKYIRIDPVEEIEISNISAPSPITVGSKLTLAAPAIEGTPSTQGWQISANGSAGWTNFDPAVRIFTAGENGYYIRYYATNAVGTKTSNAVQITVNKYTTALSISATPTLTIYPGDVVLTATLTGANSILGKSIKFYNGTNYLGSSTTGADGKAIYTVPSPIAAVHSYKAVFDGDTNNANVSSSSISFSVSKGIQPSISFANTSDIVKTYGDDVFTLPDVIGGSGSGIYSYHSSNTDVATVTGNSVTIKSTGEAIIYVKKLGDANYNDSDETSIRVRVLAKPVSIFGMSVNDKSYDGNVAASINGTNAYLYGIINSDDVSIDYTKATANFIDKNAADSKTVIVTGFAITGDDADNYIFQSQPTATAAITPAAITVTPDIGQSKYYGQSDPALTYSDTSAAAGETAAFSGHLTRAAGELIANNYAINLGTLSLIDNGTFLASNYELSLAADPVQFEIMEYIAGASAGATATPNGDNGWFKSVPITLTAPAGYQISASNAVSDNIWTNSIIIDSTDGADKIADYYLKASSGTYTDAISTSKTFGYAVDQTAPEGDISIDENSAKTFLNTITFGLFFNRNVDVTLSAIDTTSGVATIAYYKSSEILDQQAVEALTSWTEYTGTITETVVDAARFIYYVKISDNAGNVTYFASSGTTFDTTNPAITGITNGAVYYVDQVVTVTDTNLDTITLNSNPFESGEKLTGNVAETYTVITTDKAGNTASITATMKSIASLSTDIDLLSIDQVKSSDRLAIESVAARVQAVLLTTGNGASQAQIDELQAILDQCDDLLGKIAEVNQAVLNAYNPIKNITVDNVTKTDLEALEQALVDLQTILDTDASNLTDAEIQALEDQIESAKTILDVLNQIAGVEMLVNALPNPGEVTKDDSNEITNAKNRYETLSDHQKEIIDAALITKLDLVINALRKALLFDKATNTSVEGLEGTVFDLRTELAVTSVKDTLDATKMGKFTLGVGNVAQGQQIAQLYDIRLLLNGQVIQPGGMVKVTLTLTGEQADYENLQVVYIADDGTTTIIPSTVNGSEISFETDHFSYYGIIGTLVQNTDTNQIPKTGENPPVLPLVALSFLSAALLVAVKVRRRIRKD